jgi:GNAT superfamily N-acetyltransferase
MTIQFAIVELSEEQQQDMLLAFIHEVAPDQAQFIEGTYFRHGANITFAAIENGEILGVIRYCRQKIGYEQKCDLIFHRGEALEEAKINAFAVATDFRNCGVGKALQRKVIEHARKSGCSQVASYSTYDKVSNYAVKISLGFSIQPERQADGTTGCYFLMRL